VRRPCPRPEERTESERKADEAAEEESSPFCQRLSGREGTAALEKSECQEGWGCIELRKYNRDAGIHVGCVTPCMVLGRADDSPYRSNRSRGKQPPAYGDCAGAQNWRKRRAPMKCEVHENAETDAQRSVKRPRADRTSGNTMDSPRGPLERIVRR
jgi:hypothetical protein